MMPSFVKSTLLAGLCIASIAANADPVSPKVKVRGDKLISPLHLTDNWTIAVDVTDTQLMFNAEYLRDHFLEEFGLQMEISPYVLTGNKFHVKDSIVLGKVSDPDISDLVVDKQLIVDPRIGSEGYVIESFQDPSVVIVANESAGVFYGIQSLLRQTPGTNTPFQLLYTDSGQTQLDGVYIADWPDKPFRAAYIGRELCTYLTSANAESCFNQDLIGLVDKMARWKMNFLVVGTRVPTQWQGAYADLPTLHSHARDHYITPMPVLQGLSLASDFIEQEPQITEGVPAAGESFRFLDDGNGQIILVPDKNVIATDNLANSDFETEVTILTADETPGWYFEPRLLCPAGQPFCSSAEKISYQQWEWITSATPADDNTHSGAGAVKCTVSQSYADDHPADYSSTILLRNDQFIPVDGGKTYTVSFWAKAEGIIDAGPQVWVFQQDAAGQTVAGTKSSINSAILRTGSYDWTQYFVSLRTAESTSQLTLKARLRPGGYGTFTLDDFEVRRMDGALTNVIRSGSSNIIIRSVDDSVTYQEGNDYQVIDGEFSSDTFLNNVRYSFYPLNESTRIELLPGSSILADETVKLQYDFALKLKGSSNIGFWQRNYSVNEAITYDAYVCPYIEEMMAEFPSDYVFYRGVDEIRGINRDSRNASMENYELIAKDINTVFACVKQQNPNARMFLWSDMFNPWNLGNEEFYQFQYGGRLGATEPINSANPRVTHLIPRADLIPALWYYWPGDRKGILANSPDYFDDAGFEWVAAPSFNGMNIQEWSTVIADRPMNLGLIGTSWWGYSGLQKTANHVWNNTQVTIVVPD
jgi:hypothetical protein